MISTVLLTASLILGTVSAVTCPPSSTCPDNDKCTFTSGGVSFAVTCATDFYGGDLQVAQASTLTGCMRACSLTSACVGASYVAPNCYMKSRLNAPVQNTNVVGVLVTSRVPTNEPTPGSQQACPSNYTCPANDNCEFVGSDLRFFTLACGVDYYGGDLANVYVANYQACTEACSKNATCIAASFTGGNGGGYCYLKSRNNGPTRNDRVDGVFFNSRIASSSTSRSLSSATSSIAGTISSVASVSLSDISSTISATLITSSITSTSLSSSTSSSASSTSLAVPTTTPLPPGTNVLLNPGFETISPGTSSISNWTSTNSVSPSSEPGIAHSGNAFVILYALGRENVELSQTVSNLDSSKRYQISFWYSPYQILSDGATFCSLNVLVNDYVVYAKGFDTSDSIGSQQEVNWQARTSGAFEVTSAPQTIKFRYGCSSGNSRNDANILIDDIFLTSI